MVSPVLFTTPETPANLMATELDAVVAGTIINGATILDNTVAALGLCVFEFDLGAATDLSAKTHPSVKLWLRTSMDGGASYEDPGSATSKSGLPVAIMNFTAQSGAQIATGYGCLPGAFKFLPVVLIDGFDCNANDNVLSYRPYTMAI